MNVPLRFRLRRLSEDPSAEEVRETQSRYLDFVDQQGFSPHDALPKYFALDFFHDGPIDELRFSPDGRTLGMRIQVTWIPRPGFRDGFCGAWFRCEFRDVVWFSWTSERLDRANDPLGDWRHDLEYCHAEIDTLQEELAFYRKNFKNHLRKNEKDFHSLLIELVSPAGMMGLVFTRVSVWPEESLAWELFRASSESVVGLYEPRSGLWRDKRKGDTAPQ